MIRLFLQAQGTPLLHLDKGHMGVRVTGKCVGFKFGWVCVQMHFHICVIPRLHVISFVLYCFFLFFSSCLPKIQE